MVTCPRTSQAIWENCEKGNLCFPPSATVFYPKMLNFHFCVALLKVVKNGFCVSTENERVLITKHGIGTRTKTRIPFQEVLALCLVECERCRLLSVMVHVTTLTADVYQQTLNRVKGLLRQKFSALEWLYSPAWQCKEALCKANPV